MSTLSERILGARAGDYVDVRSTGPMCMTAQGYSPSRHGRKWGALPMPYPERLYILFDHIVPANNTTTAVLQKELREFAHKMGIHFSDIGGGVCHQLDGGR